MCIRDSQVAEIGYKNLEVANSRATEDPGVGFDVPADKLLEILGGFGAKVVSSHISPINEETLPAIMEYHGKIGNKYIGQYADFFADYAALTALGMPREDARFVLPYCFYSSLYLSANAREMALLLSLIHI